MLNPAVAAASSYLPSLLHFVNTAHNPGAEAPCPAVHFHLVSIPVVVNRVQAGSTSFCFRRPGYPSTPQDPMQDALVLCTLASRMGRLANVVNWPRLCEANAPVNSSYQGVYVAEGRVVGLVLQGLGLVGHIPTEFTRLADLKFLDLSRNYLTGGIPAELCAMTGLQSLDLSFTHVDGRFPSCIANMTWLTELSLSSIGNRYSGGGLTGSLPLALTSLSRLQQLDVSGNRLTGMEGGSLSRQIP